MVCSSAITISVVKLGLVVGTKNKALIFVFDKNDAVDKFLSGSSIEVSAGYSATDGTLAYRS